MRKNWLLYGGVFFYDVIRLLVIILVTGAATGGSGEGLALLPVMMYVAPNVLFPFMAFLLWTRPGQFREALPLYPAGKITAAVANAAWFFFSARNIAASSVNFFMMKQYMSLAAPVSAVFMFFLDGITGIAVIASGQDRRGGN